MKIPNKRNISPYLPCLFYCICILSATLVRWMNYFNLFCLIVIITHIFQTGKLTKSILNIVWAAFILVYPLADAKLRGETGIDLFTALCYVTPLFFLLSAEYSVENCVKPFLDFLKLAALFQAFGIYLSLIWNGLYLKVVWTLVMGVGGNSKGFASDASIAAYYICLGVGIFWFESRKYEKVTSAKILNSFCVFVLLLALVFTLKRSYMIALFVSIITIEIITSINKPRILLKKLITVVIVCITLLTICFLCYKAGQQNSLSRIWETIIGIQNDEDVSMMRSTWAELMAEWGKDNRVFGIGWESFITRLRSTQYAGKIPNGHNVYKQILCEEGYIGCGIYISLICYTVIYAIKLIFQKEEENNKDLSYLAKCVCFILLVFVIYCFTGNAIYDAVMYLPFFFVIKILSVIHYTHPVQKYRL